MVSNNSSAKELVEKYSFIREAKIADVISNVKSLKAKLPSSAISDAATAEFKLGVNVEIRDLLIDSVSGLSNLKSANIDTKEGLQDFLQDASAYSDKVRRFIIDLRQVLSITLKPLSKYEIAGFSSGNALLAKNTITNLEALNLEESNWINANKLTVGKIEKTNKLDGFRIKRESIIKDAGPIGALLTLSFADLPPSVKTKFLNENFDSNKRMVERDKLVQMRRKELIAIFEKEGINFDLSKHVPLI
jgi:hypothetical protein